MFPNQNKLLGLVTILSSCTTRAQMLPYSSTAIQSLGLWANCLSTCSNDLLQRRDKVDLKSSKKNPQTHLPNFVNSKFGNLNFEMLFKYNFNNYINICVHGTFPSFPYMFFFVLALRNIKCILLILMDKGIRFSELIPYHGR